MLKAMSAYTDELDDLELAVANILEQISPAGNLLANTIGIVSCFAEYLEAGVVKALCGKLPFPVAGATTIANGAAGMIGETGLCLLVLTSDDTAFTVALSDPITAEDEAPLRACYEAAATGAGRPAFMFSFSPLLPNVGTDFYVDCITEVSGNVPNFGTLAVDHNPDYRDAQVILNGEAWRDRYVMVLAYGAAKPEFFIGSISDEKVFPDKGAVTGAKGNQLHAVNGMPALQYLQSLGLEKNEDGSITGINSFPFIVDYNDGTVPVARAIFATTPEGYAVCGGNIPVGATLSVGTYDPDEIVATTARTLESVFCGGEAYSAVLMYSCIGRYFAQGFNQLIELQRIRDILEDKGTPYTVAYSGGEICPVYDKGGEIVNRNHNNTFIVCAM